LRQKHDKQLDFYSFALKNILNEEKESLEENLLETKQIKEENISIMNNGYDEISDKIYKYTCKFCG
jgi:hypothetical protein